MGGMFGLLPFTPRTTPRKNAKTNQYPVTKSSYYLTSPDVPHILTFGSYGILATTFGASPCLGGATPVDDNDVWKQGRGEQTVERSSSSMKRSMTTTDLIKSYEELVNDQPNKESLVLPQHSNKYHPSRVSSECRELTMQFSEVGLVAEYPPKKRCSGV